MELLALPPRLAGSLGGQVSAWSSPDLVSAQIWVAACCYK